MPLPRRGLAAASENGDRLRRTHPLEKVGVACCHTGKQCTWSSARVVKPGRLAADMRCRGRYLREEVNR